jgi:hypothetical protein
MKQTQQGVAILTPQFTISAVLRTISWINSGKLQSWFSRRLITSMGDEQVATGIGNPRLLSAANVIQITAISYLANLSVPLEVAAKYGEMAIGRAIAKANKLPGTGERDGFGLDIWADDAGKWQYLCCFNDGLDENGLPDTQERPPAFIVFGVDALIGMVAGKLTELVEEREKLRRSQRFPDAGRLLEAFRPLTKSGTRDALSTPA